MLASMATRGQTSGKPKVDEPLNEHCSRYVVGRDQLPWKMDLVPESRHFHRSTATLE